MFEEEVGEKDETAGMKQFYFVLVYRVRKDFDANWPIHTTNAPIRHIVIKLPIF